MGKKPALGEFTLLWDLGLPEVSLDPCYVLRFVGDTKLYLSVGRWTKLNTGSATSRDDYERALVGLGWQVQRHTLDSVRARLRGVSRAYNTLGSFDMAMSDL